MKKLHLFIKSILLFLFIVLVTSCTASDPGNEGYSIDPGVKTALIVICCLIMAGTIGYGLYFYIKKKKEEKDKLK